MKRDRRKLLGPNIDELPQQIGFVRGRYFSSQKDEICSLARFGCTNEEVASFYHISLSTFDKYIKEVPGLYDALQEGRMIDSLKTVDSLHKQALGYMVTEYEWAEHLTRNGEVVKLKKKTKKWVQPSTTAAIYLLKTRHGDKWMDVVKSEKTQNLNILVKNVDFSDVSTDELLMLKKLGINRIPEEFKKPKQIIQENNELIQDVQSN